MQNVGIKILKDRLSDYLRKVATGETVIVTDRGRVVAEIVPPRGEVDADPSSRQMAELIRSGIVVPPKVPGESKLPRRKRVDTLDNVLRDLTLSRADR